MLQLMQHEILLATRLDCFWGVMLCFESDASGVFEPWDYAEKAFFTGANQLSR